MSIKLPKVPWSKLSAFNKGVIALAKKGFRAGKKWWDAQPPEKQAEYIKKITELAKKLLGKDE